MLRIQIMFLISNFSMFFHYRSFWQIKTTWFVERAWWVRSRREKTWQSDSNIFTSTNDIRLRRLKIHDISLCVHNIFNTMYIIIRCQISFFNSFSSFRQMLVQVCQNDDIITRVFIIQEHDLLYHVHFSFDENRLWNILINMSKENVIFRHDVLDIIRIIDKSSAIVRAKSDIISIIRRILSHQLLCNEIKLISLSIEVVAIVHSTKMMTIHFELVQHEFFDRCFETIDHLHAIVKSLTKQIEQDNIFSEDSVVLLCRYIFKYVSYVRRILYRRAMKETIEIQFIRDSSETNISAKTVVTCIVNL
jgi:hypothetical protein